MRRRPEHLSALLDGELSARAARRLAGKPRVREELEGLAAVGAWVREVQASEAPPVPDLWPGVAARLATLESDSSDAVSPDATSPDAGRHRRRAAAVLRPARLPWLGPALAGAAAAAAAVALWLAGPLPVGGGGDVVQWLDANGRPVVVIEGADESTIIWVQGSEGDEVSGGRGGNVA